MARLIALLCASLLVACSAASGEPEAPSSPGGRIRDLADIIDPETEALLAARLDDAEAKYGPQVGIVTVTSLEGLKIEDYSLDYANTWKLGDAHRNDGLMILVAPNERKVRIQVGYGLEGSFSDPYCKEIIDTAMVPEFRRGDYGSGLEGAVDMIVAKMKAVPTLPANDNAVIAAGKAA